MEVKVKTIYIAPKLKRFVAYLIDIIPIWILTFMFFITFTSYSNLYNEFNSTIDAGIQNLIAESPEEINADILTQLYVDTLSSFPGFVQYSNYINILAIVILGLYGAYAETSEWKGTFGKKLMKIKVGDIIGQPLDGGTAFKRNVIKIIVLSTFPILMIWIIFDNKNRCPYDILAKTLVVSNKNHSEKDEE